MKIILILSVVGCDNPEYRFVAAGSGLILRNSPNPNATKVTVLPFNSKLKIQKQLSNSMIINQVEGHWVKLNLENIYAFFSPYLSEVSILEKPEINGIYSGVYGADNSIYGKLELKENNTGVLTLNFCHDMAFPKIQWERRGGILLIKLKKEDEGCCPEIKNKILPFRMNRPNQLEYIGEMIYACSVGGSGRLLTRQ